MDHLQCLKSCERAFEQFYSTHIDRTYALALRICHGDIDLAETSCTAAWQQVYTHLADVKTDLLAWLNRVVVNSAVNECGKSRCKAGAYPGPLADQSPSAQTETMALRRIELERRRGLARDYFPACTPRQKEILRLTAAGMESPAIAAALGIKPATVRVTRLQAARRLRELLQHAGPGGSEEG